MTYYVSSGTLNPTHSLTYSINCFVILFRFDSLSAFLCCSDVNVIDDKKITTTYVTDIHSFIHSSLFQADAHTQNK